MCNIHTHPIINHTNEGLICIFVMKKRAYTVYSHLCLEVRGEMNSVGCSVSVCGCWGKQPRFIHIIIQSPSHKHMRQNSCSSMWMYMHENVCMKMYACRCMHADSTIMSVHKGALT